MSLSSDVHLDASPEEMQILRNATLLPVVLSIFTADKDKTENEGPFVFSTPYLAVMERAISRIGEDMAITERELRRRGIVLYGEERNYREVSREYDCRGRRAKYTLIRGMFGGELELLMDYYLGLYDGRL